MRLARAASRWLRGAGNKVDLGLFSSNSPVPDLAQNANAAPFCAQDLPILDNMVKDISSDLSADYFKRTAIVGVQHMLGTTESLFRSLMRLGLAPENLYFCGKCYSSSPVVVDSIKRLGVNLFPDCKPVELGHYRAARRASLSYMWNEVERQVQKKPNIEKIIVLDEGGGCFEDIPESIRFNYQIAGIEQTRAGFYSPYVRTFPFPIVDVAMSAAKRFVEPPLIAEAVVTRVKQFLEKQQELTSSHVCAVIGNGAIGLAIATYLTSRGFRVLVYDENENAFDGVVSKNCFRVNSIESIIANSNYIFGCTGRDITHNVDVFDLTNTNKTFISCSSEDIEFRTLLRRVAKSTKLDMPIMGDVLYQTEQGGLITICRGGFPINFDNSPDSVSSQDIQVTRGLLLGACIQANLMTRNLISDGMTVNEFSHIALDPYLQRYVASQWLAERNNHRYSNDFIAQFEDVDWIINNSNGKHIKHSLFRHTFNKFIDVSSPSFSC